MNEPVLELYEMRRRPGLRRLWNWRLIAANGEKLARGSGEEAGGFKSPTSAWGNAYRTMYALRGSKLIDTKVPRPGTSYTVVVRQFFDGNTHVLLRIRRPHKKG